MMWLKYVFSESGVATGRSQFKRHVRKSVQLIEFRSKIENNKVSNILYLYPAQLTPDSVVRFYFLRMGCVSELYQKAMFRCVIS